MPQLQCAKEAQVQEPSLKKDNYVTFILSFIPHQIAHNAAKLIKQNKQAPKPRQLRQGCVSRGSAAITGKCVLRFYVQAAVKKKKRKKRRVGPISRV